MRAAAFGLGRPLLAASAFLTRVPVPERAAPRSGDLVASAPLFPLVGGAIGAVVAATAVLLALGLPPLLAATVAVAIELALTGALHMDALADSADGLAGRTRERSLAIMRDHALGTYGASALIIDLLAKVTALAALAQRGDWGAIIAAFAVSRAAPLPLASTLPYARTEGGTGQLIVGELGVGRASLGIGLAVALALALAGPFAGVALGCLVVATGLVGMAARRRLQGVTGDVLGAAVELTSTLTLVAAVAIGA